MNEKDPLAVSRGVKLIQLLGASTLIALLSTQSVYAADGSSPFLGIPGWVWLLLVLAILIGVTLLPKKWIEPPKIKKMDVKPSKPTPVVKAPVVKAPVSVVKPQHQSSKQHLLLSQRLRSKQHLQFPQLQ
jgi:hypothetical protein